LVTPATGVPPGTDVGVVAAVVGLGSEVADDPQAARVKSSVAKRNGYTALKIKNDFRSISIHSQVFDVDFTI
jgi:hypothetical protein